MSAGAIMTAYRRHCRALGAQLALGGSAISVLSNPGSGNCSLGFDLNSSSRKLLTSKFIFFLHTYPWKRTPTYPMYPRAICFSAFFKLFRGTLGTLGYIIYYMPLAPIGPGEHMAAGSLPGSEV